MVCGENKQFLECTWNKFHQNRKRQITAETWKIAKLFDKQWKEMAENLPKFLVDYNASTLKNKVIGWVLPFSLVVSEICSFIAEKSKNICGLQIHFGMFFLRNFPEKAGQAFLLISHPVSSWCLLDPQNSTRVLISSKAAMPFGK